MTPTTSITLHPSGQEMPLGMLLSSLLQFACSITVLTSPEVGFGLWKVENDKAADLVQTAIKAGVRLFDGTYHLAEHSNHTETSGLYSNQAQQTTAMNPASVMGSKQPLTVSW